MELINALKMVAGETIVDSHLSKSAKYQLLNFIQHEATEHQIKALLIDGEIVNGIDEQAQDIIDARFEMMVEKSPDILKSISSYIGNKKKGK